MLSAPSTGPHLGRAISSRSVKTAQPEQDFAKPYSEGVFQDPPKQKSWLKGAEIFTAGHKRLVDLLRGECVQLSKSNSSLRSRIDRRDLTIGALREELAARTTALNMLTEELDTANDSLRQIDTMMKASRDQMSTVIMNEQDKRSKRLSVLGRVEGQLEDPVTEKKSNPVPQLLI